MSIKANGVESYKGQVVQLSGHDERIMSDVWEWMYDAVVIDGNGYKTVSYLCGTDGLDITVDANPEQIKAYKAFVEAKAYAQRIKERQESAYRYAAEVNRGKVVKVVKGRAAPAGTQGIVFWMGSTTWGDKVGIALDDSRDAKGRYANVIWTYKHNVETVIPQNVIDEIEAIK